MIPPTRYRKLIIHALTGDFRTSTMVTDEAWRDPLPGQIVIRNRYAGCNAIFDKNLCRNRIRYLNVQPPFDMGIESVGEIVAVGTGLRDEDGDRIAMDVAVGNRILFGKWSGTEITLEGEELLIMKESDILGVIS